MARTAQTGSEADSPFVFSVNEVFKDIMQRSDAAQMLQIGDNLLLVLVTDNEAYSSKHFHLWL